MSDREVWVHPEDNADEVGLECADHAFGDVAAMHVWRYFLVLAFPFDSDVGNVRGACFVIEYLEVNSDAPRPEALHDLVVRWDAVGVGP
jgi:hypothetical protein